MGVGLPWALCQRSTQPLGKLFDMEGQEEQALMVLTESLGCREDLLWPRPVRRMGLL